MADNNIDNNAVSSTYNEVVSPKDDAAAELENKEDKRRSGGRDLQVSALVHLMGLPTKDDYKVLEKKVDLLSNKLTSLAVKVDRVLTEISQSEIIGAIDRVDMQVADLHAIVKKLLAKGASLDSEGVVNDGSGSMHVPKVK